MKMLNMSYYTKKMKLCTAQRPLYVNHLFQYEFWPRIFLISIFVVVAFNKKEKLAGIVHTTVAPQCCMLLEIRHQMSEPSRVT